MGTAAFGRDRTWALPLLAAMVLAGGAVVVLVGSSNDVREGSAESAGSRSIDVEQPAPAGGLGSVVEFTTRIAAIQRADGATGAVQARTTTGNATRVAPGARGNESRSGVTSPVRRAPVPERTAPSPNTTSTAPTGSGPGTSTPVTPPTPNGGNPVDASGTAGDGGAVAPVTPVTPVTPVAPVRPPIVANPGNPDRPIVTAPAGGGVTVDVPVGSGGVTVGVTPGNGIGVSVGVPKPNAAVAPAPPAVSATVNSSGVTIGLLGIGIRVPAGPP